MAVLRNLFAVVGVMATLYAALYIGWFFYDLHSPKVGVDGTDLVEWKVVSSSMNAKRQVEAVVEVGTEKMGRAAPFHRVSLHSRINPEHSLNQRVVWESQSPAPPSVAWLSGNRLVVSHPPTPLFIYEPEVRLSVGVYRVLLRIAYDEP